MDIKTHECEYGKIEYRMPDVSEMMILFGKMGVEFDDSMNSKEDQNTDLIYVGRMIKYIKPMILKVELKDGDGVDVCNYDDALKKFEFMAPLSEIAAEIMKSMEKVSKKKKQSKK